MPGDRHTSPLDTLFRLSLLAGLAPLLVLAVAWLGGAPNWADLRVALLATAAGGALVVVLVRAWIQPFFERFSQSAADLSEATARVAERDFTARVDTDGPCRELRELSAGFNRQVESLKLEVLNRQLELEQASELCTASKRLIEECLYAREPLAKQHPGLAAAYAEAVIRNSGEDRSQDDTVDALVYGVDHALDHKGNRESLRWTRPDITVEVPVPSKLINMSVQGMAVESNRGLPVGGSWVFRVGNGAFAYDIPGKVRWCKLDRTVRVSEEVRPIYRTGVSFDEKLSGAIFDFFSPAEPTERVGAVG